MSRLRRAAWLGRSSWSGTAAILTVALTAASALSADTPPVEADVYRLEPLPIPPEVVLEAGALERMPDGRLAVSSRRGEIWMIDGAFDKSVERVKFTRYAHGLHEVLGLAYRDGWLYATQRCELSRLKDTDGDGRADLFETVNDDWGITGDYHEYAFGSRFDSHGHLWIVHCLTGSFTSEAKFRGWCLRISPDGRMIPTCSGIRSPGGIGMNHLGDMFYTDNQGPWNGTCTLRHLEPGKFMGHPEGNKWYAVTNDLGPRPKNPQSGSRFHLEGEKIPQLQLPAVFFPYAKMGQSASGIACDTTGGKFGPFGNQLFVGDQTHSTLMRVCLEKIDGHYQGACFPFRQGFGSGSLSLLMTPDGSLFVGGTNRGWGSRGTKPFSLDRLRWTGILPFEIHEMRARSDGFELSFTQPVDPRTAGNVESYGMQSYTYIYQESYGSPEVDHTTPRIERAIVGRDGRRVRLVIKGLTRGHVHELQLAGVRAATGSPLLHPVAYYTLNYVPGAKASSDASKRQ